MPGDAERTGSRQALIVADPDVTGAMLAYLYHRYLSRGETIDRAVRELRRRP
jgi:hypothetical protein